MRSRPDPRLRAACDRLLDEGVPPRVVERLAAEWSDHLVSATEGLRGTGIGSDEARCVALRRLGDDETLTRSVLAWPGVVSPLRRHPLLAFVVAPVPVFVIALAVLAILGFTVFDAAVRMVGYDEAIRLVDPLGRAALPVVLHGLAPALALAFFLAAWRRRCHLLWPFLASVILAVLGGGAYLGYAMPVAGRGTGAIDVGFANAFDTWRVVLPLVVFTGCAVAALVSRRADQCSPENIPCS